MPNMGMKSVDDYLQELLEAKDAEIERLSSLVHEAEDKAAQNWVWTAHVYLKQDTNDLPLPRLELRWMSSDEYEAEAFYFLVYYHLLGEVYKIPLGHTVRRGSRFDLVRPDGSVDMPSSDGAHIMHDMEHLRLPAFAIDEKSGTVG